MVKITAATAVVVTNWVSIGTFHERSTGLQYDVQLSYVQTNLVGKMEAAGQTVEHVFHSSFGPTNPVPKFVLIATQNFSSDRTPPNPFAIQFFRPPQPTNR